MADLEPGLYDRLVDRLLATHLDELAARRLRAELETVDPAELPQRFGELIGGWARQTLAAVRKDEQADAVVQLSRQLSAWFTDAGLEAEATSALVAPVQRLTAIEPLSPTNEPLRFEQPRTPLRDTVLITNARGEPSLLHELESEIHSAERIDLVLAFIRHSGIRPLLPKLARHVEAGKPLRVLTTIYTGSTELRALEALVDLGAEVKVSYDTTTTRLHAKAWLFERHTGFSTVYIGSSNLTHSAQVTGQEWNVRASQHTNPDLIAAFGRSFDTYWEDRHFEPFDRDQFVTATKRERADDSILTPFSIEPFPFQRRILEQLEVARANGRPHNLVVAATGTGKTVMAALDYRALRNQLDRSRLLFVAHRPEILDQSRATFRHVLRDGSFGERWVDGDRPEQWDHVFASVQSIAANDVANIDPTQFDVVIVDEFHHAAAASYDALLEHLRPQYLLGLTATPERADGQSVLHHFGDEITVELRLWDALEEGLLAPFHYFGIHDGTDLSGVSWRRGAYDTAELADLYTADDVWASKIVQQVLNKIGEPLEMRALGFCVSKAHAKFMAEQFTRAGFAARAVDSDTHSVDRQQALNDLRDGKVQILFTVDLFNEGVDLPAVDTVLMLRPTESATVFLQQLGRGLRRSDGKDVLTVLDFVGHQRTEFRFDLRFRQMLGRSRRQLESDVADEFPFLPAGCHIHLDPVAKSIVLNNVKKALPSQWRSKLAELRRLGDVPLRTFLDETGLELPELYGKTKGKRTWTELRREAGLEAEPANDDEATIGGGIGRLLHLDDAERIDTLELFFGETTPPTAASLSERERRTIEGALVTLLSPKTKSQFASVDEAVAQLWQHEALRRELLELLPLLRRRIEHLHRPLGMPQPVPLQVHATYSLSEILAGFGAASVTNPPNVREGVYWDEASQTDLFFVTLQKAEKDYSPTTQYLDYAISESLFHWESQSTTSAASATGRRYIEHRSRGTNVVLFVRPQKIDEYGRTMPYFCAGPVSYVKHESERPMQITWRLAPALPGDTFGQFRAAIA